MRAQVFTWILGITSAQSYAQVQISIEPEIGINSSGVPRNFDNVSYDFEKQRPLLSASFGILANVRRGRHFHAKAGIRVARMGYNYHFMFVNYSALDQATFVSDHIETYRFSRFSIPILIGYDFVLAKTEFSVSLGLSQYHITKGKYFIEESVKRDGQQFFYRSSSLDPYDPSQVEVMALRVLKRYTAQIGVYVLSQTQVALSYTTGGQLYFQEKNIPGRPHTPTHYYSLSDYTLSVVYQIPLLR